MRRRRPAAEPPLASAPLFLGAPAGEPGSTIVTDAAAAAAAPVPALDVAAAQRAIDGLWASAALPSLCELLAIPSGSPASDPEWESNGLLEKRVALLAGWAQRQAVQGLRAEVLRPSAGVSPALWVEVAVAAKGGEEASEVLMYGHVDRVSPPPGACLGWYAPTQCGDNLVAHEGCDNGYALYGATETLDLPTRLRLLCQFFWTYFRSKLAGQPRWERSSVCRPRA